MTRRGQEPTEGPEDTAYWRSLGAPGPWQAPAPEPPAPEPPAAPPWHPSDETLPQAPRWHPAPDPAPTMPPMPAVPEPPREGVPQQRNSLDGWGEEPAAPGTWSAPSAPAHAWHAPNGAWSQQMPPAPQAPPQPPPVVPVEAWDARPAPLQQPGPDPSMVRPSRAARHEVQRKPRQKGIRARRAWPVRLALFGAIAALMLLCWFVVFPWLETVLPSEF